MAKFDPAIDRRAWELINELSALGVFKMIHFHHSKETKTTQRFEECSPMGSEPVVKTLYIRKWFLDLWHDGEPPESLLVFLAAGEDHSMPGEVIHMEVTA